MTRKALIDALLTGLWRILSVGTLLFLVVPLIVVVMLSFDAREFLGPLPPTQFSLRWYDRFFANPDYMDGLAVSLQLSSLATAIAVVAGVGAALCLWYGKFRGSAALETFFLSPKFVPTVVIGFSILGLASVVGLYDAFTRMVLGHVVIIIPFVIRTTLSSLVGIRYRLVEAAQSLGAKPFAACLQVVLPIARTGVVAGALMAFVLSFDEVAVSLFLSDAFNQTLPIVLVSEMRANLNLTIAAVSTTLMALVLVLLVVIDRTIGLERVAGEGLYRG